ncbi:MAG TPA: transketolase [Candidatus Kapabacteria bacterium]|nr:transketolase [Candidatus Kapabacteria bacterium]
MNHQRNIDTIRLLAADMVEAASSGHPGLPLGAAPMAYALWTRHLRFNPENPTWAGRDRFVLSAGHGSALLYALLHVFGYPKMSLEQLRRFRQIGSLTPGHPEYHLTPGVEVSTGPLGQGISNAVGIALAERHLAATFSREGFPVADFRTFVLASDGDLMEGVSSEASSLAGHLRLARLVVLYDDNNISIDGSTDLAFTEDVGARYRAYGWHVDEVADGNDVDAIDAAIARATSQSERPTLIRVRTVIGYGAPTKANTAEVHGSALGAEELRKVKEAFGFDPDRTFVVEDEVRDFFNGYAARGAALEAQWTEQLEVYRQEHADVAEDFDAYLEGRLPDLWRDALPRFAVGDDMATRQASGKVLDAIAPQITTIVGGSADLTPSNNTRFKGVEDMAPPKYSGRYIRYGVREHAMGSIMNGMAATGLIPYAGTFLTFSDYMRGAIRLAALSGHGVIYVFTHDSIGLGEDGPTHQPIEHVAALRTIPNLVLFRPADANETAFAWRAAIERRDGPTALALTRQKVPTLAGTEEGGTVRGAYILADIDEPDLIIAASGSEVHLAVEAARALETDGIAVRVVSMPSWEIFEQQDDEYRDAVFPDYVPVLGVEAGVSFGWERYADDCLCIERFGMSAPAEDVFKEFGFTAENIANRARRLLESLRDETEEAAARG